MIYSECLDLGRRKECQICIVMLGGRRVSARMAFFNRGKNTYNIFMCKDTDNEVVISQRSHKGKPLPDYAKKVVNVLSELVLPSIYYKECVFDETR